MYKFDVISIKIINSSVRITSVIGILLSIYAYIVETSKEHDAKYIAMCDISEHMSCSKVFTSVYGRGFGILHHFVGTDSILNQPNSVVGVIFYALIIGLTYKDTILSTKALIAFGILSNLGSIYLASILYFVLYDFCVVCVSTYVVNAINLILAFIKLNKLLESPKKDD